jgi:hypothetical protein
MRYNNNSLYSSQLTGELSHSYCRGDPELGSTNLVRCPTSRHIKFNLVMVNPRQNYLSRSRSRLDFRSLRPQVLNCIKYYFDSKFQLS